MVRFLILLALVGVAVYALADLVQAHKEDTAGIPKWMWAVIIVIVPGVGPAAWIVFRRAAAADPTTAPRRPGTQPPRRRGPVAPDDDPEFLRRLDEARNEARKEQERREREDRRHEGTGDPQGPQA